jgi:hypothetical protein
MAYAEEKARTLLGIGKLGLHHELEYCHANEQLIRCSSG